MVIRGFKGIEELTESASSSSKEKGTHSLNLGLKSDEK